MRLMLLLLFVVCAPALCWSGGSETRPTLETETSWMKVLLDGRKIGLLVSTRVVAGEQVTTTERMEATIDRAGISLALVSEETSIETRAGEPLGFRARTELSGIATVIEGKLEGDKIKVTITSGDRVTERTMDWPKGALLAEGVRLLEERHGVAAGAHYEALAFQPSNLIAVPVKAVIKGKEKVSLGLRDELLVRIDQRIELPGAPMDTTAWVDADFDLRKAVMPLLGLSLEMIACSEKCAKAPNQTSDIFASTVVVAPRSLAPEELAAGLELRIAIAGNEDAQLPSIGEQQAAKVGDGAWRVRTDPGDASDRKEPAAADRGATRWLESDAPELIRLAETATQGATGPLEKMQALESKVRSHIADKSLNIGYASALETVRTREGDCTEHALLLAALGRALGIPTRVVSGLAYAPAFAGRDQVFVPHAWTQAWIGDHWQSFDAALPGFDAGHIAFTAGDGDPVGFYAGVNLLGNIRIESVRALAPVAD